MRFKYHFAAILISLLLTACIGQGQKEPAFKVGTIFISSDIITESDPTTFAGLSYIGIDSRTMFDRRVAAWVTVDAFLFDAVFADGNHIEVQVNPEFNSVASAQVEANRYANYVGQLPAVLRKDVETISIHQGKKPFGGGNNNILIHIGQAEDYLRDGILEETLVHEATHTSLDSAHANAPGWLLAQQKDNQFISQYAEDNPLREDVAETFLLYLAVRLRPEVLSTADKATLLASIPNRLSYFDDQKFNLSPLQ